ncbi:MAG: DUF4352 domain-containing protein [Pseudonocardiaceae bacterium]
MTHNPQQPPFRPILPPEGQHHAAPQPPAPKQRNWFARHKVLTAVLGVVAVIGIASVAGGNGESPTSGDTNARNGDLPETAGLNDPVRDGKFEFVVSKVECGKTTVGDQYLNKTAQGQFCLVSVSIENIGNEPQSMFGDNQKLFDAEGREFSADTEAAIYLGEASQTLWEEINPGNKVEGVVVFDIPENVTPTRLELHDSAFSGGVVIGL